MDINHVLLACAMSYVCRIRENQESLCAPVLPLARARLSLLAARARSLPVSRYCVSGWKRSEARAAEAPRREPSAVCGGALSVLHPAVLVLTCCGSIQ